MVVPPAVDGQVADIDTPDHTSDDTTSRSGSTLRILSAAFAVVVIACLVALVVRYATVTEGSSFGDRTQQLFGVGDDGSVSDADERDAAMSQADQFMLRVNTYGPSDLDGQDKMPGYAQGVREVITPKFAVDFDKNVTLAEQSVAQAGYAREAQLLSTGVDTIDDDTASVLVAGIFKSSYPDSRRKTGRIAYPEQPFRVTVSLVKVDGTWLVDDFTPIASADDATGGSGSAPSASATPNQPSGTASSGPRTPSGAATTGGAKP